MTDYWFVVHDLMAYGQHADLICCKARTIDSQRKKPLMPSFKKMGLGDQIVYYAAGSFAVIGIFKITSHSEYFSDDVWPDVFVRRIVPIVMPPKGKYMHLKKLLFESDYDFDIFPNKEQWHTGLRGKTLRKITKLDFDKFRKNMRNEKFLVSEDEVKIPVTVWQKSIGNE